MKRGAPARPREVRWRPVDGDGLEHLTIGLEGREVVARGVVIGERGGQSYGVDYTVVCDEGWVVRSLDLATTSGIALSIRSDGVGAWRNHDGRPLAEFEGCHDVDLAGSAFTNTLPIRRIDWPSHRQGAEIGVVYVPFDTFVPVLDWQRYTCLEDGQLFRYEAVDRSFSADLPVDEDGLVLDYPTLFRRA